jgi:hypothetical protein
MYLKVARIISKSAWGKVTPPNESDEKQIPGWQLAYDQLSWTKPENAPKDKETGESIELRSYHDYLQEAYPVEEGSNVEQNRAIHMDRLLSFARPGGPAAKFKNIQEKMLKALNLPKGAKEELNYPVELVEKIQKGEPLWDDEEQENADPDDPDHKKLTEEEKLMMDMFGEGKFHLIPSFFRTLIYLKKQKREFSVCFRTFGSDLNKIVWEFNRFCSGTHPCYSGRNGTPLIRFDGSKNAKDLRIRDPSQRAFFVRGSSEAKDANLVQGTFERPDCVIEDEDQLRDALDDEKYEEC